MVWGERLPTHEGYGPLRGTDRSPSLSGRGIERQDVGRAVVWRGDGGVAWRARWFFPEAAWGSEREATEARLVFPLLAPWVLQCRVSSVCY